MLKTMRRNVKSLKPILWLIVITFIAAIFTIWGGAGRLGEANRSDTLASVGGTKISSDAFYQALRSRLEAIGKQFGGELNAQLIQQLGLPQQTLEQLIQQRLLLAIAADMGLRATDAEVRDKIIAYPALQQEGKFVGFENYRRILEYNHIPLGEFEAGLRQDVLMGKVVEVLTAGIFVTDEEVWQAYRKQNDSAKIEYLVAETAKTEVTERPTEAELRAHFDRNTAIYKIPEKRIADYVVLRTADLRKEVTVKDEEIAKYYRDNTARFQEPEKVQVSRIWLPFTAADKDAVLAQARGYRGRAAGGEDFAALVRSFSKDDKAAAGGDWGLYDWRSLTAPETEAVAGLDKGGVSEVIETETGAAILKVTEKTPAVTKALAPFLDIDVQSRQEFEKTQTASVNQLLGLVYALLGLAVLIALIGIVNTLMLSVFERTREIGLLRAVGMRRRQVQAMIRSEAVILAIFGAVIGIVIGTGMGVALVSSLKQQGITDIVVPVPDLVIFLLVAAVLGLIAATWPARRAARLDVLAAIAAQ